MVPSTPTSFENPATIASSVSTGAVSSSPTSDQVPEEMYPNVGVVAGTAATAEAVSCPATVHSGTRGWSSSEPTRVPAVTTPESNRRRGMPSLSITSTAHVRVVTSSSWLVLARVSSVARFPVSQYPNRSGSITRRCAASRCGEPSIATSWLAVVIGSSGVPVTR
jgi:hypothetical protein